MLCCEINGSLSNFHHFGDFGLINEPKCVNDIKTIQILIAYLQNAGSQVVQSGETVPLVAFYEFPQHHVLNKEVTLHRHQHSKEREAYFREHSF